MVKRDNELVDYLAYPYGFTSKVVDRKEVEGNGELDTFVSIYTEVPELVDDLGPSVKLTKEPITQDQLSSLLRVLLSSGTNLPGKSLVYYSYCEGSTKT
ncbi:hypothetical protein AYI68_g6728 [Smittium mucronatum]|uniref:Uncharacterized protein n=1 Tax=Smittium mucronatum TaxID=133383 RepID=A0A1R0GQN6_9FUNG|nr:hypothetical protein AYI68_g6728 [Smittium mucronatum]